MDGIDTQGPGDLSLGDPSLAIWVWVTLAKRDLGLSNLKSASGKSLSTAS